MGIACTKFPKIAPLSCYLNSLSNDQNNRIDQLIKAHNEEITIDIITYIYASVVYTDNIFFLSEQDKKKIIFISKFYGVTNNEIKKWRESVKQQICDPDLSFEQIMEIKNSVSKLVEQYKISNYNNVDYKLNDSDKEKIKLMLRDNNISEEIINQWIIYINTGNWPLSLLAKKQKKIQIRDETEKRENAIAQKITRDNRIRLLNTEPIAYVEDRSNRIKTVHVHHHHKSSLMSNPMALGAMVGLSMAAPQLAPIIAVAGMTSGLFGRSS
jgi:hypothetical protein